MSIVVFLGNKVLTSGQWPSDWKSPFLMLLFKRENPKVLDKYYLIAFVPALSEVMEKSNIIY